MQDWEDGFIIPRDKAHELALSRGAAILPCSHRYAIRIAVSKDLSNAVAKYRMCGMRENCLAESDTAVCSSDGVALTLVNRKERQRSSA